MINNFSRVHSAAKIVFIQFAQELVSVLFIVAEPLLIVKIPDFFSYLFVHFFLVIAINNTKQL